MLSPELLKKIKGIQIRTRRLVNDVLAGEYVSAFKGRGMEFEEVREYVPGDEVRSIDWNVTARMGQPFVKQFKEERELTIVLMVDISASGWFGTVEKQKQEIEAELAAALAYSAVQSNDKVGLILFGQGIERFIPPKKGKSHVFRVIKEVLEQRPERRGTGLAEALAFLNKVIRRRAVVFLITDFMAEGYETALKLAAKKHDLIVLTVQDPRERELPAMGYLELEDAETGEVMLVDTSDNQFRKNFSSRGALERKTRERLLASLDVDSVEIAAERSFAEPLLRFFHQRERRR